MIRTSQLRQTWTPARPPQTSMKPEPQLTNKEYQVVTDRPCASRVCPGPTTNDWDPPDLAVCFGDSSGPNLLGAARTPTGAAC
jgi:hypothetical protein